MNPGKASGKLHYRKPKVVWLFFFCLKTKKGKYNVFIEVQLLKRAFCVKSEKKRSSFLSVVHCIINYSLIPYSFGLHRLLLI